MSSGPGSPSSSTRVEPIASSPSTPFQQGSAVASHSHQNDRARRGGGTPLRGGRGGRPHPHHQRHQPGAPQMPTPQMDGDMVREPETQPISQDQLVAEVKGIYAGLVMVESKCIEVDNSQMQNSSQMLTHDQWQALIALHRTLLHEHHDFFLASQHPSASPALKRLATKYAMPARMWRHGIHSFLELLRHRLPHSFEHMLTFIYLAYSMMALLRDTVPTFEDTWIECLGDLGRYRMAIEDDDIRDREVWTNVSKHWYSKSSDKAPTTGRLYHHLAILSRPRALQQLFYYCKSLAVPFPFKSARESITTLFEPVFSGNFKANPVNPPIDLAFLQIIGVLFTREHVDKLEPACDEFYSALNDHIQKTSKRWQESGYFIAIILSCAVIGFGLDESDGIDDNFFLPMIKPSSDDNADAPQPQPQFFFEQAISLMEKTLEIVLGRYDDTNVLQFAHCMLVFVYHVSHYPEALEILGPSLQWPLIIVLLNTLLMERPDLDLSSFDRDCLPISEKETTPQPLPEDSAMRGLLIVEHYHEPSLWIEELEIDEKYFEVPSMMEVRKERLVSLGFRICARANDYLRYDGALRQFEAGPEVASGDAGATLGLRSGEITSSASGDDDDDEEMVDMDSD